MAQSACNNSGIITPPEVDFTSYRGYVAFFTAKNLDGESVTFSVGEITEPEFSFFFGFEESGFEPVETVRKVITVLKL